MVPVPLALTSLVVRWAHVLGMALALGGAVLTWVLLRRVVPDDPSAYRTVVDVATAYEWVFWGAVGVLVMTGVGNLGALAPDLPAGRWGLTLGVKLVSVVLLLCGSAVRTLLLGQYRRHTVPLDTGRLRTSYAVTAVHLGVLLVLAEVLAHG